MAQTGSDDAFIVKHPFIAGFLFTLMLMPAVYFGTGAHETGVPTLPQMGIILLLIAPVTGLILKYFASRSNG